MMGAYFVDFTGRLVFLSKGDDDIKVQLNHQPLFVWNANIRMGRVGFDIRQKFAVTRLAIDSTVLEGELRCDQF